VKSRSAIPAHRGSRAALDVRSSSIAPSDLDFEEAARASGAYIRAALVTVGGVG
jgi:hypothetical protein